MELEVRLCMGCMQLFACRAKAARPSRFLQRSPLHPILDALSYLSCEGSFHKAADRLCSNEQATMSSHYRGATGSPELSVRSGVGYGVVGDAHGSR